MDVAKTKQACLIRKIILLSIVLTVTELLFLGIGLYSYDSVNYGKKLTEDVQTIAQNIAGNNVATILNMDKRVAIEILNSLDRKSYIEGASIYTADGSEFARYRRADSEDVIFDIRTAKPISTFTESFALINHQIISKGELIGYIQIRSDLSVLKSGLETYQTIVLFVFLTTVLLSFCTIMSLYKRMLKPLNQLMAAVTRIKDKSDYTLRITDQQGRDQIGSLITGFNHMVSHIESQNTELVEARNVAVSSLRTKEIFLANMSHEIRTPLNTVVGMATLLDKSSLSSKQSEHVHAISVASKNLLVIINDILDFSKIESGKLELVDVPFSLDQLLQDIQASMQIHLVDKDVCLTTKIDNALRDKNVIGDPVRLNQILLNLVSNAIKFTEKGSIKIECRQKAETGGRLEVKFRVIDTGIGIEQDKINDVFNSFVQANQGISKNYGGTGLGLTITKSLVELYGGKINLTSCLGKGCCFEFSILLKDGTHATIPQETEPINFNSLSGLRILTVEDNVMNQMLAKAVFEEWEIGCEIANNGKEAVDLLKKEHFDCVLMDIQMPVMDGIEATKIIRNKLGNNVPIIALTGTGMKGDKEKFASAGMNDFLIKPYSFELLFQKIERHVIRSSHNLPIAHSQSVKSDLSRYHFTKLARMAHANLKFTKTLLYRIINNTPRFLEQLQDSINTGHWEQASFLAGRLKSSLNILELDPLHDAIIELENEVHGSKTRTKMERLCAIIQGYFDTLVKLLEEIYANMVNQDMSKLKGFANGFHSITIASN
ncbi:MAG: response regulator [Flavobacteriales bacterium]|nr:response regulator [Flavobacteriales bacterium]